MVRRGTERLRRGRWIREESGQGLVEYALIITIVSLGAVVALGFLSNKINGLFSSAGNSLNNVTLAAGSGDGGGGGGGGAPAAPVIAASPGSPTDGSSGSSSTYTSPSFSFSSDAGTTFLCSLDGAGFSACTSPQSYSNLGVGSHTFAVEATNASGTSGAASVGWSVTALPLTDGLVMADTGAGDHYNGSGTYHGSGKVETCRFFYFDHGSWHCSGASIVNTAGVWLGATVSGLGGDACSFTKAGYVPWTNRHWSNTDDYYLVSNLSVRFTRICS